MQLERLYLSDNAIDRVCQLAFVPCLRLIDLSFNRLNDTKDLAPLEAADALRELAVDDVRATAGPAPDVPQSVALRRIR